MSAYPQGFYLDTRNGWQPALGLPLDHVRTLHGSPISILLRSLMYVDKRGRHHVVKSGLITDGLSIPRACWWLVGHPYGRYLLAGCVHDYYCAKSRTFAPGEARNALRSVADELFGEMCAFLTPDAKVAPAVFERAVKVGAVGSRWTTAQPDYEHDLVGAYLAADIPHCIPAESARRG